MKQPLEKSYLIEVLVIEIRQTRLWYYIVPFIAPNTRACWWFQLIAFSLKYSAILVRRQANMLLFFYFRHQCYHRLLELPLHQAVSTSCPVRVQLQVNCIHQLLLQDQWHPWHLLLQRDLVSHHNYSKFQLTCRSPLFGTSAQPFLEPLVLLVWILGTLGFPWITTFHWMVTHLCINPDHCWLRVYSHWANAKANFWLI